jgi:hypothetical protein
MPKRDEVATPTIAPIDSVMILAMLSTGITAGFVSHSELLLATPIMAGLVFVASKQAMQHRDRRDIPPTSDFPPEIAAAIERAMDRLPAGDGRRLLADVVREARPLFVSRPSAFDASKDDEARAQAAELITASCDTALELSQLDDMLDGLTAPVGDELPTAMTLLNRLSSARDLFANRWRAASLALSGAYAAGVENGTPASDRVAELVAELKADAGARSAAKRELNDLLGPQSG